MTDAVSDEAPIGFFELDVASLPADQRFAVWASTTPFYDVSTPDPGAFELRALAWSLPPVVVTDTTLSPITFVRTDAHIRADGLDDVVLQLIVSGRSHGDCGGAFATEPGDIMIEDRNRPVTAVLPEPLHAVTASMPRSFLDERLPDADVHGLVLRRGTARLLSAFLSTLPEALAPGEISAGEAAALLRDLLVASLRRAGIGSGDARLTDAALRARARRHIDRNLTRPLDLSSLCEALGVSRSRLYRVLGGDGGVAAYIRQRRLNHIHRLIQDPAEQRSIAAIAELHGFVETSHFHRLFRRTFGYTPGALRSRAVRERAIRPGESVQQAFVRWHKDT